MSEPKPFASLSSGLLARKGGAKPAMRPQGYGQFGASLEDLGWDDMGPTDHAGGGNDNGPPEHVPSSIAALTPAPGGRSQPVAVALPAAAEELAIVEQQRALEEHFAPPPAAMVMDLPQRLPEAIVRIGKAKAAFTLRLDAERHLKLRLASALTRRSAQQIVTEALDALLSSLPQVDALARQVPDSGRQAG